MASEKNMDMAAAQVLLGLSTLPLASLVRGLSSRGVLAFGFSTLADDDSDDHLACCTPV
jgi:hypothetical protein